MLRLETTLESEADCADEESMERWRGFLVKKVLKTQMGHTDNDSRDLVDLKHKFDGAIAKKRRAQNTVTFLQSQLASVPNVVERYRQGLFECRKHFTADLTDNFSICCMIFARRLRLWPRNSKTI